MFAEQLRLLITDTGLGVHVEKLVFFLPQSLNTRRHLLLHRIVVTVLLWNCINANFDVVSRLRLALVLLNI